LQGRFLGADSRVGDAFKGDDASGAARNPNLEVTELKVVDLSSVLAYDGRLDRYEVNITRLCLTGLGA
jgi:hypothetical protein